jgi:hypothetical protein
LHNVHDKIFSKGENFMIVVIKDHFEVKTGKLKESVKKRD